MTTSLRTPLFASRADLITTVCVAIIAVAYIAISLALRLAQILPNTSVPVLASVDEPVALPLGPGGDAVSANVSNAYISVSGMPAGILLAVAGTAVVPALAALGVIACGLLLVANLLRGRFFSRVNTRLIALISLIIAVGWLATLVLQTIASNGAIAVLSGGSPDGIAFQLDFTLVLVSMGVACLGAAFRAGERMQRDSDGLI